jgi:Txe/YoeB family toxin of Txe-Axe toxin-antitoxin module
MRKPLLIFSLVFIFSTAYLDAYVIKRYTWWNLRTKRLEKLLANMNRSSFADSGIKSLIENDIKAGRDFLTFHNRRIYQNLEKVKDPGSMTRLSLKNEIRKRINPVVAFSELEELTKRVGSPEIVNKVKQNIWKEIEKIMNKEAGFSDKALVDFIGRYLIQKSELKMLSTEMVIFRHLHNVEKRIEKFTETLAGAAMFKIKNNLEKLDSTELYMRITEWGIEACSVEGGREYRDDKKNPLARSRRWQFIRKRLFKLIGEGGKGLSQLNSYRERPAFLVKRLKKINRELQQQSIADSTLLMKTNRIYLEKIAGLVKRTASAGIYSYPYLEGRIRGVYTRVLDIYRYLVFAPGIRKENMRGAPDELLDRYHIEKKRFSEDVKKIKKRIDTDYRLTSGKIAAYRKNVIQRGKSLRKYTAQHELNLIITFIEDYSSAYRNCTYESEILNRYSAEFARVEKELRSKNYKVLPGRSAHEFSLLKTIRFNRERLEREKHNKEIIKKEGLRLISSLQYLVNYYKRKNADINYYPASRYILQLKNRFKGNRGVKIGSWTMTSENYAVIDRNVSALFRNIISRNTWRETRSKKNGSVKSTHCSVKIGNVRFSLNIPRGWVEESVTETERSRGIMKKFISIDRRSSINLAKIHSGSRKGMDIKKTGEIWAGLKGMKPVMKKWGKKKSLDYYWIFSRDGSGAVNEIYTLQRGHYTFILSGRTDAALYRFFRGRMESVFDSIEFRF